MVIGKLYQAPAMDLNAALDWSQMPQGVRGAFCGRAGKRVRLEAHFELYKFTQYDMVDPRGKITEWWSPVAPYGDDPGLAERLKLARLLHTSPADLVRVMAAVREDWNELNYLLQARLEKPVWAWWGQCATQPRRSPPRNPPAGPPIRPLPPELTHNLPGYAWQFYIPRLTPEHITRTSREPVH